MSLSYGSVFEWKTLGRSMTYLLLEAAFFFALTLCIDARVRKGRWAVLPSSVDKLLARCDFLLVWFGKCCDKSPH